MLTQLAAPIPPAMAPGSNLLLRDMQEAATEPAGNAEVSIRFPSSGPVNKPLFNTAHRISDKTGPLPELQMLCLSKTQLDFSRPL